MSCQAKQNNIPRIDPPLTKAFSFSHILNISRLRAQFRILVQTQNAHHYENLQVFDTNAIHNRTEFDPYSLMKFLQIWNHIIRFIGKLCIYFWLSCTKRMICSFILIYKLIHHSLTQLSLTGESSVHQINEMTRDLIPVLSKVPQMRNLCLLCCKRVLSLAGTWFSLT